MSIQADRIREICQAITQVHGPAVMEEQKGSMMFRTGGPNGQQKDRRVDLLVGPTGQAQVSFTRQPDGTIKQRGHIEFRSARNCRGLASAADAELRKEMTRKVARRAARDVNRDIMVSLLADDEEVNRIRQAIAQEGWRIAAETHLRNAQANTSEQWAPETIERTINQQLNEATAALETCVFDEEKLRMLDRRHYPWHATGMLEAHNRLTRAWDAIQELGEREAPAITLFVNIMMPLPAWQEGIRGGANLREAVRRFTGLEDDAWELFLRQPEVDPAWKPKEDTALSDQPRAPAETSRQNQAIGTMLGQALRDNGNWEEENSTILQQEERHRWTAAMKGCGAISLSIAQAGPEAKAHWLHALRQYLHPPEPISSAYQAGRDTRNLEEIARAILQNAGSEGQQEEKPDGLPWKDLPWREMVVEAHSLAQQRASIERKARLDERSGVTWEGGRSELKVKQHRAIRIADGATLDKLSYFISNQTQDQMQNCLAGTTRIYQLINPQGTVAAVLIIALETRRDVAPEGGVWIVKTVQSRGRKQAPRGQQTLINELMEDTNRSHRAQLDRQEDQGITSTPLAGDQDPGPPA